MSCYGPLTAYRTSGGGITFQRGASLSGTPMQIPCGQCIGCRLEKSRQWAMRCMHEARLSKESSFVTLTYEDEYLPPGGTLVKRDLQLFMKRLRKAKGEGVRFYACGEYGTINKRPHYHVLLFNCGFPDRLRIGENKRGEVLYTSAELRSLWNMGFNVIGDVTFDSAAYVARYVIKKVSGKDAGKHYEVIDGYGVVYERIPEFAVMSRRPGLGSEYYERYGSEVRAHDSVVVNGHEVRPPRFYDTRTEVIDEKRLNEIKRKRKREAMKQRLDNTSSRLRVKEKIAERKLELKGKPL